MINRFLKNPVNKFLLWVSTGIVVCLIGMTNVFALSTTTSYASYSNGSLSNSGKYNYGYLSGGVQNFTTANIGSTISGVSYGFMFYYSQNISLGNTYTLVINFHDSDLLASVTSNWVKISTCNSSACNENTLISMTKSNPNGYSNKVTFKFNPISVGSVIRFEMGGDNNQPLTGVSNFGISSIQIDAENTNQDIINNNTSNTNNIINNNNSNTQDIINNQNQNNNELKETIENQYNNCKVNLIDFTPVYNSNSSIFSSSYSGNNLQIKSIGGSTGRIVFKINNIEKNTTYTISYKNYISNTNNSIFRIRAGTGEGDWLSSQFPISNNQEFTFNSGNNTTAYLWFYFLENTEVNVSIYDLKIYNPNYCINKLDEQTNAINGLNDTLKDDSSASFDSSMINLIPNAPITNLLTIPISLLQSILTRANNTCSPISIPFLFNHNITFPCFTLSDYFGSVANTIDLCICFVMIYNIFMLFVSVFEDITTLRDGFLGLYEPQHAVGSYKPRHGKG